MLRAAWAWLLRHLPAPVPSTPPPPGPCPWCGAWVPLEVLESPLAGCVCGACGCDVTKFTLNKRR